MLSEFKKFIMRGNVLDLAVGVIIGAAFGKIVASLVADILMPVIGLALGKIDFSSLFVYQPQRRGVRDVGGGQSGQGSHAQLRSVPEHLHRIPDRRVCNLYHREAGEPDAEACSCCGSDDEGLSAVLHGDSAGGEAVSGLHFDSLEQNKKAARVSGLLFELSIRINFRFT